jgi:hypothetical protein
MSKLVLIHRKYKNNALRIKDVFHSLHNARAYVGRHRGMIDGIGTSREGGFYFTLRWLNPPAGTRSRPIADRSLNLWVTDLAKFECLSSEEAHSIMSAHRPTQTKPGKPI